MTTIASSKLMQMTSDYPVDMVVCMQSGSYSLPSLASGHITTIPHGLPFVPLCGGSWSMVSDFSLQYEFSIGTYPSGNPSRLFGIQLNVFSDATNIYISGDNPTGGAVTIYYRVYGFEPSDSAAHIDPLASVADDFVINSDYNLPKLFMFGKVSLPATTVDPYDYAIAHNIGTTPQTLAWVKYQTYNGVDTAERWHPMGSSNGAVQDILLAVNDNYITFRMEPPTDATEAYYRIYLDS